jgi:hypothetical protein
LDTTDCAWWETSDGGLTGYQACKAWSEEKKEFHLYRLEEVRKKKLSLNLEEILFVCVFELFGGRDFYSACPAVWTKEGGVSVEF